MSVTRPKRCKNEIYKARYHFYGEAVHSSDTNALENTYLFLYMLK